MLHISPSDSNVHVHVCTWLYLRVNFLKSSSYFTVMLSNIYGVKVTFRHGVSTTYMYTYGHSSYYTYTCIIDCNHYGLISFHALCTSLLAKIRICYCVWFTPLSLTQYYSINFNLVHIKNIYMHDSRGGGGRLCGGGWVVGEREGVYRHMYVMTTVSLCWHLLAVIALQGF